MSASAPEPAGVRQRLAAATGPAHEALHVHPASQALLDACDERALATSLTASTAFHSALERLREDMQVWPVLSLAPALTALRSDCLALGLNPQPVALELSDSSELLGALYVAHGSQFGRQQIHARLRRQWPEPALSYFALPTDARAWRALLGALEVCGQTKSAFESLRIGADVAFKAYHSALDAATPCKYPTAHSLT